MKAARCLLIHVPKLIAWDPLSGHHSKINFLAMGMFSLAEELENAGIETEILHLGVEKSLNPKFSLSDYVQRSGAVVAAFSLHWHPQTYDTLEAARQLKKDLPGVFIVLGGFTASYFAREILQEFPWVDAVIRGEGERPLSMLVRKVAAGDRDFEAVENLVWKQSDGSIREKPITYVADSDQLNRWSFSGIGKVKNYDHYLRLKWQLPWEKDTRFLFRRLSRLNEPTLFGVSFGRGCYGNCTWCSGGFQALLENTGRKKAAWRDPAWIADSIEKIRKDYGIQRFYVSFDPIPVNDRFPLDIFEQLGKLHPRVRMDFECFGLPSRQFIRSFRKNFHPESLIILSPEVGSERLRKEHRSFSFSNAEMEDRLSFLEELRAGAALYFTLGLPGETRDDVLETYRYSKYLKQKYRCLKRIFFFLIEMEPGSPWFEDPEKFQIKLNRKTIRDFYEAHSEKKLSLGYDSQYLTEEELLVLFKDHFGPRPAFVVFFTFLRALLKMSLFWQRGINRKQIRFHGMQNGQAVTPARETAQLMSG